MTNNRFRHALKMELTDNRDRPDFETIEELKRLMQMKGFRQTGKYPNLEYAEPTHKQLDYAYKYLTRYSQVKLIDFGYEDLIQYRYGKRIRKRDPVTGRFMK